MLRRSIGVHNRPSSKGVGGGHRVTHVCAYETHFEEVLADMRNFGVAAERRWIEILYACSDAFSAALSATEPDTAFNSSP